MKGLLEDLAVSPLILLASDLDRLVPCPHGLDELLVLGFFGVKGRESVALVVGCDIEGVAGILTTDEERALNYGIIFDAINRCGTEDILATTLKTGEETTWMRVSFVFVVREMQNSPIRLEVMKVIVNSSLYL